MPSGVHPAPQKFTTFTTFTTFAMFAKFAKFAKFANVNSALEHPTLIQRHAPRLGSISERASRTSPLSCLRRAGYPRRGALWAGRVGGEGLQEVWPEGQRRLDPHRGRGNNRVAGSHIAGARRSRACRVSSSAI
jgi:hypothetical protein